MPCPAERILRLSPTYALEHCVPVTARLSKRFYDVLGEDVANELVDWFSACGPYLPGRPPRSSSELNYARFEAKLEQRLAELRAELRQELGDLRAGLRAEIADLRADLRAEIAGLRAECLGTELQEVGTEVHQGNTALERVRGEAARAGCSASGSPPSSGLPAC